MHLWQWRAEALALYSNQAKQSNKQWWKVQSSGEKRTLQPYSANTTVLPGVMVWICLTSSDKWLHLSRSFFRSLCRLFSCSLSSVYSESPRMNLINSVNQNSHMGNMTPLLQHHTNKTNQEGKVAGFNLAIIVNIPVSIRRGERPLMANFAENIKTETNIGYLTQVVWHWQA